MVTAIGGRSPWRRGAVDWSPAGYRARRSLGRLRSAVCWGIGVASRSIGRAGMTDWIGRLWRGEVGLASAFWEYAIVFGTFAHVVATGLAYGAYVAGASLWSAVTIFFLMTPYTVLATVGVWRSAERYEGPAYWAHAARVAVVLWAI